MSASRSSALLAVLGACLGVAIGSLGPWKASLSGTELGVAGAGVYTLLLAAVAALLAIPRRPWPAVVFMVGLVCSGIAVVNVVEIAGSTREPVGLAPPAVEVDWGLWLTAVSSIALVVAGGMLHRELVGGTPRPRRMPGKAGRWIGENPVIFGLLLLLGIGLVLRILLMLTWSPAFTGYSDAGIYFQGAVESIWSDPVRMVGYSMFVEAMHAVTPHLIAVTVVQHALGLGAAALVFFAVRRCGGPAWLGLLPAGVIALGGDQLFIEHAALSDALFIVLVVATLYAAIRAIDDGFWWAALAGVCAGLSVWARTVGLGVVIIVAIWFFFRVGRPNRQTLITGVLSLGCALLIVGIYAGWRSAAADLPGALTSNNAWNLYGRVAPWADCEKFEPPPGTEELCEERPASQRGYHSGEEYIYSGESPAQQLYGPPYLVADPEEMEQLQSWSEAAIRGQPIDYLDSVWLDTRRLLRPNAPSYGDLTADAFTSYLIYGLDGRSGSNEFVESWQAPLYPDDPPAHRGDLGPFETWEAMTRVVNVWMAALLALCLVGPWVLSGRPRAGMLLFAATGLMLLFFPIVTKSYDYRFVIPAFAPLAAAGALAGWGLATRVAQSVQPTKAEPSAS